MFTEKLKKIFTNTRVIIVLLVVLFGIISINPQLNAQGVTIRNVARASPAYDAGIPSATPNTAPTSKERILSINSIPIKSVEQYYQLVASVPENASLSITTSSKKTYLVKKGADPDIGITVYAAPTSNLRLGLDLQGGTRVILQPAEKLTPDQLDSLITSMTQRLNVYGLSDISVRSATDLSGNQFVVVEIAGANEQEVKDLLSTQGKFEAKIGNQTVFMGGSRDITYVCKTADCSGIDPYKGCYAITDGYACAFRFSIALSAAAAQRQANISKDLAIVPSSSGESYLNETLSLFLDDKLYDKPLNIGSDLKGRAVTDIQISGTGTGRTIAEAQAAALADMKKLQTVLGTGSLPTKINIVKSDTVSPTLGEAFTKNALFLSFVALIVVAVIIGIIYKRWEIIIPMLTIAWIEIFLTLATAALIGWNLDIPSIAGIIIAIGQGANDQMVITDETLRGGKDEENSFGWKMKIQRAFFIVLAAYFTSMGAMVTMLFAGAGMLRGFAITSIIGYTIGVALTRPAYSYIIEVLLND